MYQEKTLENQPTQGRLSRKQLGIIGLHAFVGWALCTAAMVIPMQLTTIENALMIHATGAPIIFTAVSLNYFKKFNFTTPLKTGLIFVGFIIFMDFFLIAMIIMGSFEMFASLLGTWIPFALIFTATYITGSLVNRNSK